MMFVLPLISYCQDISFKNISTVQGLSSNLVYSACQGPDGLLWIIANNRLDSYNEGKVTNYTNDIIDGIEDYKLFELIIDNDNIIWLKTRDGVPLYLDRNRRIHVLDFGENKANTILNFIKRKNGRIDILTEGGHFHYNVETKKMETIHLFLDPVYTTQAIQISNEKNEKYVISANNKIILYNALNGTVDYEFDSINTSGAAMINDRQIVASTSNQNELFIIDLVENRIVKNLAIDIKKKFPKVRTYYRRVKHIDDDQIAVTSGHEGLFIINVHNLSITNYTHSYFNPSSISSDNTFLLFANDKGNVFITSRTSGLNMFNIKSKNAKHIRSFVDYNLEKIFEGHISHVARDKDGLFWLASSQGLIKYNALTHNSIINAFRLQNDEIQSVLNLYIDHNDNIWLSISENGIEVLDKQGNKLKSFLYSPLNPYSLKSNTAYSISIGFDNKLWVGTTKGINKIDKSNFQLEETINQSANYDLEVPIREIKTIGEETFVGTWRNGSYVFTKRGVELIDVPVEFRKTNFTAFAKDKSGNLYQGTLDGVLISNFDSTVNKYVYLGKTLKGRILSIDEDGQGYLWIATENVLYKYNPVSKKTEEFNQESGFTGGGFRMHASFMDKDGRLYYGMNTGLCFFNPIDLVKAGVELNPFINAITVGNTKTLMCQNEDINLSVKDNIGFYYQNVDIWSARNVEYQYSMSGSNDKWVPAITNPVLIQNIEPGKYKIKLRASYDGKNWVNAANEISLNIAYPWWRSWWFYILAFSVFMAGSRLFYKFYSKLQAERQEEKKYDESLKFFSISMHKYGGLESEFWDVILECIHQINVDAASIYLKDHNFNCYIRQAIKVRSKKNSDYLDRPSNIPFGQGQIGLVGESGKTIIIDDLNKEKINNIGHSLRHSKITIPILSSDRILGVIDCEHQAVGYFNERRLSFILAIAAIIATKIEVNEADRNRKNAEISLTNNLKKVSELEMKSLRSQMNPHFMFNSLNSINNFIVKNDQENASDYLTNFAQLMRIILENSRQDWVPLGSELRALRLYIGMEKLRFENLFLYHESISEDLNIMTTLVPPMLIQPYIENAIWHGLLPKKSTECNLMLSVQKSNGNLIITIEDDGIGTKMSMQNKSSFNLSKKSFGLKIISERLDMINEIYNLNANVKVYDKSEIGDEKGTKVVLSMKIKMMEHERNNN